MSATDSATGDTFRVKIWKKEANGGDGAVIYDNLRLTPGGASAADDVTPTQTVTTGSASIMISSTCR